MEEVILRLLREINPYELIEENSRLIEEGILDSVGVVTLIGLLEEEFDLEISGEEMVPENFMTLACIEKLILRLSHQEEDRNA